MTPVTLTVVFEDRWRIYIAVVHEGEAVPPGRRIVQIQLTPEQVAALRPQQVGSDGRSPRYETIRECWLEPIDDIGEVWPEIAEARAGGDAP